MDTSIGIPIKNICNICGTEFYNVNPYETECLACKISREMKLPKDTIINHNVLNIYMNKQFSMNKGVDPIYLKIAEGVALTGRKRTTEQICTNIKFMGEKSNKYIEKFVNKIFNNTDYCNKYDAFVFIKVSSYSNFKVFGISLSDRIIQKLADKDVLFYKNYIISLVVNCYWGKAKK